MKYINQMGCQKSIKKYNFNMKKIILFFTVIFILFLSIQFLFNEKDYCLDKGGCWNHHENKCEMNNQLNCLK